MPAGPGPNCQYRRDGPGDYRTPAHVSGKARCIGTVQTGSNPGVYAVAADDEVKAPINAVAQRQVGVVFIGRYVRATTGEIDASAELFAFFSQDILQIATQHGV